MFRWAEPRDFRKGKALLLFQFPIYINGGLEGQP